MERKVWARREERRGCRNGHAHTKQCTYLEAPSIQGLPLMHTAPQVASQLPPTSPHHPPAEVLPSRHGLPLMQFGTSLTKPGFIELKGTHHVLDTEAWGHRRTGSAQ